MPCGHCPDEQRPALRILYAAVRDTARRPLPGMGAAHAPSRAVAGHGRGGLASGRHGPARGRSGAARAAESRRGRRRVLERSRGPGRGSRGEELESCGYAGGLTVIICGVPPRQRRGRAMRRLVMARQKPQAVWPGRRL